MKKYILTDEKKDFFGIILYRTRSIKTKITESPFVAAVSMAQLKSSKNESPKPTAQINSRKNTI